MTELQQEIRAVTGALSAIRTPAVPGEYDIHAEAARALEAAGIDCMHEYRLGPRCRIDFLAGRVGIEIKKGRPVASTLRGQIERYLRCDGVDAIIVVTQRNVPLPASICGKPVILLSLNRLWGVALP